MADDSLPEGFTVDQAQQSSQEPQAAELPSGFQLDSEKYGTTGQQAIAGIEGIAKGLAGPLAPMAERAIGVPAEDIAARAEQNPWTHGIGEATGLIGGAFIPGVGEYTLGAKVAGAGQAAAKAAEFGKIGSAAIKMGIEAGLLQASDEASKIILNQQDPETPVASALAHIGASTLLGGGLGYFGGKAGAKLEEMASSKLANKTSQFLADFGNRFNFLKENPDIVQAGTDEAQTLLDAVRTATSDGFSLKRTAVEKLTKDVTSDQVSANINSLSSTLAAVPRAIREDLRFSQAIEAWENAVKSVSDPATGAVVSSPSAADAFEATDNLKRRLQDIVGYDKLNAAPEDKPFRDAAHDLATRIKNQLVNESAWGQMGEFQNKLNKHYSEAVAPLKDFISAATSKMEGMPTVDPAKINSIFNSKLKGKTLANFKADKIGSFLAEDGVAKNFLRAVDELHESMGIESNIPKVSTNILNEMLNSTKTSGSKAADWFFSAGPKSIGLAGGHAAGTIIGGAAGHPYLGYRAGEHLQPIIAEGIGRKVTRWMVPAVLRVLSAGNTEGIGQALSYSNAIEKGANKINSAIDNVFAKGGQKALNSNFNDAHRDNLKKYVESGSLNQQIQNMAAPASGPTSKPEEQSFAHGGEVLAPKPSLPTTQAVGKAIEPQDHIATIFPEQSMLLGAAKSRINNYLNSIRPKENQSKMPFDDHIPNKEHEKKYHHALDLANSPLSILDHVKNGTLTPDQMLHFNNMYPELSKHLQKKLTDKIVQMQMNNEKPDYHLRQSLSLFLGSPMDSTFTPQSIQSIQSAFGAINAQKKAVINAGMSKGKSKGSPAKLDKLSLQFRTSEQAREDRKND